MADKNRLKINARILYGKSALQPQENAYNGVRSCLLPIEIELVGLNVVPTGSDEAYAWSMATAG